MAAGVVRWSEGVGVELRTRLQQMESGEHQQREDPRIQKVWEDSIWPGGLRPKVWESKRRPGERRREGWQANRRPDWDRQKVWYTS